MKGAAEPAAGQQTPLRVLLVRPAGLGWAPVTLMARLAAHLLDGQLLTAARTRDYGRIVKVRSLLPVVRTPGRLLLIAATPGDLQALLDHPGWWRGYDQVAAWVIDSFWDDRIPRLARHAGRFDQLFVADAELVSTWQHITGTPTAWLPWGTDALGTTPPSGPRAVDLQRVGRQPAAWDDDEANAAALASAGLVYAGRPPQFADDAANQASLQRAEAAAKFTLSFSNRHSAADYTHPTREYLTGRWTDALAQGASVAGLAPDCESTRRLLWPGALVDLGTTERAAGLEVLKVAAASWTPAVAAANHLHSLERLDWRRHVGRLAGTLGWETPTLAAELARLDSTTQRLRAQHPHIEPLREAW